jgi:hypothetical protein
MKYKSSLPLYASPFHSLSQYPFTSLFSHSSFIGNFYLLNFIFFFIQNFILEFKIC